MFLLPFLHNMKLLVRYSRSPLGQLPSPRCIFKDAVLKFLPCALQLLVGCSFACLKQTFHNLFLAVRWCWEPTCPFSVRIDRNNEYEFFLLVLSDSKVLLSRPRHWGSQGWSRIRALFGEAYSKRRKKNHNTRGQFNCTLRSLGHGYGYYTFDLHVPPFQTAPVETLRCWSPLSLCSPPYSIQVSKFDMDIYDGIIWSLVISKVALPKLHLHNRNTEGKTLQGIAKSLRQL